MDETKLKPYDRLQTILSEKNSGKLTDNASNKLDFLLNEKEKNTFLGKISNFFGKINNFVFPKSNSKMTNHQYHKR